ncbi:nitrogenase component 1 [Ruminiclostridium papyrosolvens]|uniref:Hydrogenase n=1 Tax=Ruminiclostridium papyrosolvens C7 TaxID=1330534 RepID=U4R5V0_9FIRM|nr:nitrogenase component 1 [Ruminiclostridium papyrosolvens]EPR13420.1 hydrogenase [Ruminiclostridium papyrosolvens C7]
MSQIENSYENQKTNSISRPRYGCAIGAMYTASAIPGVVPITHCGPGCADKQYVSLAFYNGFQGGGYGGGAVPPSLNASENEVVFGGNERLKELIQASIKVIDADLFVVLTGCIPDLVGDDVPSVVSKFQEKGVPIVYAETGGFKGNNYTGHELVTKAIIDQYIGDYEGRKKKNVVNVWTEIPYQNPFWRGDLSEIKRILEGIGLKVNILFGHDSKGVEEWKEIPKAQFNLVISTWLGLDTAKHLEKKYEQPFLHIPVIPIGAKATSEFLRKVSGFAGLNLERTEQFIQREEKLYYKYLEDFSDFYAEYWWGIPSKFAVVGESSYNLAITKFLVNQLGLIPVKQIITENPPEVHKDSIRKEFLNIADDVSITPLFLEDGYLVEQALINSEEKPSIILGTTWDRDAAKQLGGNIVEIGFPASYEVVLSRANVGYRGALSLIEKIFTIAISASA